jgi:hypothetical protein
MPEKYHDDESVHNTTLLSHFNILALINKLINKNTGKAVEKATVAVIPINPNDESIDRSLIDSVDKFKNGLEDRVSIVLGRGYLRKIGSVDQITGCSHWTGLHLRRMDDGNFQAYHMDSFLNPVPPSVTRILKECGINNVTPINCNRQTDGHSCGYHAVYNLQKIHEIEQITNASDSLTNIAGYKEGFDSFKSTQQAWLQTQFNQKTATTKVDQKKQSVKKDGAQTEDATSSYQANLNNIVCSEDDYLDKIRKIIEIQDRVKEVSDEVKRATINSLLNFENYYDAYLSAFAQKLNFQCSLSDLANKDKAVLEKREDFYKKLSNEITKDPKNFLEILTAIDKHPELIDTINEINADEDLKDEIEKKKKFFSSYIEKTEESEESEESKQSEEIKKVAQFISDVDKVFKDNPTTSFRERLDQLVALSKLDSVPDELKDSFNFLSKVDENNFLPVIIPEYFQPQPKVPFQGWGLKAVFNGLNLTIQGKEVSQIHDKDGKDILEGLKKAFKDDPKLFAYAVIDFFRRTQENINLVYKDETKEELNKYKKKSIKIVDGKVQVQSASEDMTETDNVNLFIDRIKSYSDNSATKASTKVILTKSDKEVLGVFKEHINQRFELLGQLLANDPNKIAIIPGSKGGDEISCSFANGLAVNQWKDHCGGDKDRGDEMANRCRELFTQKSNELEKKYPKQVLFGHVGMRKSSKFLPQFPVGGGEASYKALFENNETGDEHKLISQYESLYEQLGIKDEVKDVHKNKKLDEKIIEYRKLLFEQDGAPLANKIFIHVWGANVGNFNNTTGNYQGGSSQAAAFKDQVEGVFGICSTPIGYDNTKKADLMADCKTHRDLVAKSPSPSPGSPVIISTPPIAQGQAKAPAPEI